MGDSSERGKKTGEWHLKEVELGEKVGKNNQEGIGFPQKRGGMGLSGWG